MAQLYIYDCTEIYFNSCIFILYLCTNVSVSQIDGFSCVNYTIMLKLIKSAKNDSIHTHVLSSFYAPKGTLGGIY